MLVQMMTLRDIRQQKEHIAGMLTDLLDERQKLRRFWDLFLYA